VTCIDSDSKIDWGYLKERIIIVFGEEAKIENRREPMFACVAGKYKQIEWKKPV
jgi:hypothetical protein